MRAVAAHRALGNVRVGDSRSVLVGAREVRAVHRLLGYEQTVFGSEIMAMQRDYWRRRRDDDRYGYERRYADDDRRFYTYDDDRRYGLPLEAVLDGYSSGYRDGFYEGRYGRRLDHRQDRDDHVGARRGFGRR